MQTYPSPVELHRFALAQRGAGRRIVLVPTMGALHDGHLELVRAARRHGDTVIASIFVNPAQFGPSEDFARYPRDPAGDSAKLATAGCDALFLPTPDSIYPPGFDTYVVPTALADVLCGASRPGHFRGVCTVVALLFRMSACHAAVFGEKDFQQLQIIRRMNTDLWLGVDIVGHAIVRDADGLALSSRNAYLSHDERHAALALPRALAEVRRAFAAGERSPAHLAELARQTLAATDSLRIDYAAVVSPESLRPPTEASHGDLCALAAYAGKTRLIDNARLG